MLLYTIGFARKSAEQFFNSLIAAGVQRLIDTRLRRSSQLAAFARYPDLAYFLGRLGAIEYAHEGLLVPSSQLLEAYRRGLLDWSGYAQGYRSLLVERSVERRLDSRSYASACLLCSEARPERCHRRLAAEYLAEHWPCLQVHHIL
jgi:uncharacterized protein (DUF488 family)